MDNYEDLFDYRQLLGDYYADYEIELIQEEHRNKLNELLPIGWHINEEFELINLNEKFAASTCKPDVRDLNSQILLVYIVEKHEKG